MIFALVKSSKISATSRLDSPYFLNIEAQLSSVLEEKRNECVELGDLANVKNPPIFKRQFCRSTSANAVRYFQSSEVGNALEGGDVFINKAQAEKVKAIVKQGQILVTGFGTIGNLKIVNKLSAGSAYANNVCRIECKDAKETGFVYAFLSSKYGQGQLNKNASGSVVRFIEAPGIKKTLIPKLTSNKRRAIAKLIEESNELRMGANLLIQKAEKSFEDLNRLAYSRDLLTTSENSAGLFNLVNISNELTTSLKAKNFSKRVHDIIKIWNSKEGVRLKDFLIEPFRIGGNSIVKRISDKNFRGLDSVSQTDLHTLNPKNFKQIKPIRIAESDLANDRMVLFPAVGNGSSENEIFVRPMLAYKIFEGKYLSSDIGKFRCSDKYDAAYLFTALRSKAGFRILRSLVYGTQLRRPNWQLIKNINIPIRDKKVKQEIALTTLKAFDFLHQSNQLENEAIFIIENIIESWRK